MNCDELSILEISDGTTTVNLLNPKSGFHVSDWNPSIPGPKDDGVWQGGPFQDGRRLVVRSFANAIETMTVQVRNWKHDDLIKDTQEIRRLLEKAVTYWTTKWQNEPVWIHARSYGETNERWAIICDYRTPNDDFPYGDVWTGISNAAIDDFSLVLERTHWLETEPSDAVCVWAGAEQEYDATSATNLVLNPGFETAGGGGADIWQDWQETVGTGALADVGGADVHSGAHACRITAGATVNTAVEQHFTVTPLTQFSLSMWTKGDGVNAGRYQVYDDTHALSISYKSTGVTGATYAQVSETFIVPSGCVSVGIYLRCPPVNGGIAYFDDMALYRTFDNTLGSPNECPSSVEVLANRGFEEVGTGGADLWLGWTEHAGTGAIADSTPHTGAHAVQLTANGGDTYVKQRISVVPGKVYTLSAWTRTDAGDGNGFVIFYDVTHAVNIGGLNPTGITGVVYQQFTKTVTVPAGCVLMEVWFLNSFIAGDVVYYDDASLTYVPDCTCEDDSLVYIANKNNLAQITDIYFYDAAPGLWSDNLAEATPAFQLLPDVPAAGDFIYFGIDTILPNSGPFCSLVFDLFQAQDDVTCHWDYSDGGAGWPALTTQDNTNNGGALGGNPLDTAGVGSVHWVPPAGWLPEAVHGVTAYWVRVHVSAVGGSPVPPIQQKVGIYTIVTPFAEVSADQIPGDINALLKMWLDNVNATHTVPTVPGWEDRIIFGLRSISRGTDFTPYINLADEQNPTGMVASLGAAGAWASQTDTPSGRMVTCVNPAAAWTIAAYITISSPLASQYHGRYRALLRGQQTSGASGTIQLRLEIASSFTTYTGVIASQTPIFLSTNEWQLVDFGNIALPPFPLRAADTIEQFYIIISVYGNGAADCNLYDLILMPADECTADLINPVIPYNSLGLPFHSELEADRIGSPKNGNLVLILAETTGQIKSSWNIIGVSDFVWQANAQQRLWMIGGEYEGYGGGCNCWKWYPHIAVTGKFWRQARYLSMRGSR